MLTKQEINHYCLNITTYLPTSNFKDWLTEINRQAQQAIDLAAENERLKADMKELIAGNETIHSIIDGTIKISGDIISMIRIGLVDMFRSSGATNFLIQNLKDPKTGEEFTMNIQKTDALLPEQKYISAQAENDRLKAKLETLREAAQAASTCGDAFADEVLEFLAIIKDGDT